MTYKAGSWNAICDVCGFKFKATEMQKRWDGLMVCSKDFEHDHPQKYLKVREDNTSVPWVRTRPADLFTNVCYPWTSVGMADFGTADCARADITLSYETLISFGEFSAIADIAISDNSIAGAY